MLPCEGRSPEFTFPCRFEWAPPEYDDKMQKPFDLPPVSMSIRSINPFGSVIVMNISDNLSEAAVAAADP